MARGRRQSSAGCGRCSLTRLGSMSPTSLPSFRACPLPAAPRGDHAVRGVFAVPRAAKLPVYGWVVSYRGEAMSYQPYPSGGAYQPYPAGSGQLGQRPEQPTSVRNAVWLMYGGAALSALSAILVLALSSSIRTAEGKTPLTLAQIHSVENVTIAVLVVVLLIGVGLWVWMAWANGRGRNWARIMASVLFGLNTIYLVLSVSRAGLSVIFI